MDGGEDCMPDESDREGVTHKRFAKCERNGTRARMGNARDEERGASGAR